MKFHFKAKTEQGAIKHGVIEALDRQMAIQLLQKNKMIPLVVEEEAKRSRFVEDFRRMIESPDAKTLMLFFRELAALVTAKVPVVPALKTIGEQTDNAYMLMVINDLAADIEDGMTVSEALSKHPEVFTPLMVSMIRSGEVSGNLQGAIEYVTKNIENSYELNQKVKGALMYPIFVISVALIIGFITMTFILPRLTQVIEDIVADIPWYTQVMISIGDFMQTYWWVVIIFFIALIFSVFYYVRTDDGRREWDRMKIKLPIVGTLFRYIYITRFSENLAVLLSGGIPIVRSLIIVADVVGNSVYRKIILTAAKDVKGGGDIYTTFSKSDDIPPIVSRMIKVGEETGKLDEILDRVADFYRKEVEQITRNMSSLIEPILIVILGIGVGLLVFSVLMPIYNIADQL